MTRDLLCDGKFTELTDYVARVITDKEELEYYLDNYACWSLDMLGCEKDN